jgi:hypothetical protein
MSVRKRESGPSVEGNVRAAAVELENLRQEVVREKSKGDAALINRMVESDEQQELPLSL